MKTRPDAIISFNPVINILKIFFHEGNCAFAFFIN